MKWQRVRKLKIHSKTLSRHVTVSCSFSSYHQQDALGIADWHTLRHTRFTRVAEQGCADTAAHKNKWNARTLLVTFLKCGILDLRARDFLGSKRTRATVQIEVRACLPTPDVCLHEERGKWMLAITSIPTHTIDFSHVPQSLAFLSRT